ncbi:MAG: ABC transporter ATP-binding protein [Planctomycetes bacterium]|nr:ABC transporter ATP-binding protein [Planctomycetota bacterium]
MHIEVKNLSRHFGRLKAVDGISFAFGSGQVCGFVGPNGAGKTTTMRVMATLDEPTSGDVFLDGVSVTEYPEKARKLLGFVPDTLPEYGDMTVHEYLDFFARAYGLRGRNRTMAVDEVEEFTNLTGLREKLIKALSKGMKQRVSLGRALVHNPAVLVLDEPAAGLDPTARLELRELLAILAQQNKAVFISSHILTELTTMCHRVVIIEKGRLVEEGTIEDMTARRVPKRTLIIRPVDRHDELCRELLQTPSVEKVKRDGDDILVEVLHGSEDTVAILLSDLVRRGYRIVEFRQKRANLEDVFMSVTKGELQ